MSRAGSCDSAPLVRTIRCPFSYLALYFSEKAMIAASAVARSGACQISRRSAFAAGWTDRGSYSRLWRSCAPSSADARWPGRPPPVPSRSRAAPSSLPGWRRSAAACTRPAAPSGPAGRRHRPTHTPSVGLTGRAAASVHGSCLSHPAAAQSPSARGSGHSDPTKCSELHCCQTNEYPGEGDSQSRIRKHPAYGLHVGLLGFVAPGINGLVKPNFSRLRAAEGKVSGVLEDKG